MHKRCLFKIRFWLVFVILVSHGFLFSQSKTQKDRQMILKLVETFITGLYKLDKEAVKPCLSSKVIIREYSFEEIKKSVNALIVNKISSLDYVNIVTGMNIYKILAKDKTSRLEIIKEPRIIDEIYTEVTMDKGKQLSYFFVKVFLVMRERNGASSKMFYKTGEINLGWENGQYKIFGFIL